jgi:hypothetical protein
MVMEEISPSRFGLLDIPTDNRKGKTRDDIKPVEPKKGHSPALFGLFRF